VSRSHDVVREVFRALKRRALCDRAFDVQRESSDLRRRIERCFKI